MFCRCDEFFVSALRIVATTCVSKPPLLHYPSCLGFFARQVIIDVAVTGVDGQSRTSDEAAERPLQARDDQKMTKYDRVVEQNNLRFIPTVFSHAGQIQVRLKPLLKSRLDTS